MLDEKALAYLSKQAIESATPKRLEEVSSIYGETYRVPGGTLECAKLPEPRDHRPASLHDLIVFANDYLEASPPGVVADAKVTEEAGVTKETEAAGVTGQEVNAPPVVWFDSDEVVVVLDPDRHRAQRATLMLRKSAVFTRVVALRDRPEWLEQKAFLRLLKIELANALPSNLLLEPARKVKFDNGTSVTASLTRDRESMGRTISSEVSSESGVIPEEVELRVRPYVTAGETDVFLLSAAVEVDPLRAMFRLVPLPDEIDRVCQLAIDSIRERLQYGLTPAIKSYYGMP